MKFISQLFAEKKPVLSFEVFPPKREGDSQSIFAALSALAQLEPDFISVTYGASGSAQTADLSRDIAKAIEIDHHTLALAHLTGISATREQMKDLISVFKANAINNILALRGDPPQSGDFTPGDYPYAVDLIREIKSMGDFCVGAACYPEGHISCDSPAKNWRHMQEKQEAGADFFISQLFFDNNLYEQFLENAVKQGISQPICAGIMPILSKSQIERMIFMCGVSLPSTIIKMLYQYQDNPNDLKKAGIEYSVKQAEALVQQGVSGVHIYTMNQPAIAQVAMERLRPSQSETL